MKSIVALGLGILAIIVALMLASGTTNQDSEQRPVVGLAMATALHATPSATPTKTATLSPTFTPAPTPTRIHLTVTAPDSQDILALLFQYPQQGSVVIPGESIAIEPAQVPGSLHEMLIVTGEGAQARHQGRDVPAAYGAVLLWVNQEYVVAFEHVEFGHTAARVNYSVTPDTGKILFLFQDIGIDFKSSIELRRFFTVSCSQGKCDVIYTSVGHTI